MIQNGPAKKSQDPPVGGEERITPLRSVIRSPSV